MRSKNDHCLILFNIYLFNMNVKTMSSFKTQTRGFRRFKNEADPHFETS